MFTNTFKSYVQNQFDTRSAINMNIAYPVIERDNNNYSVNNSINWSQRTPFIFAYSNLRYNDLNLQENMKWSVLSSFKITGSSYENYILQNKIGFYDFYENDPNFGIVPQPHITSLNIKGRGNNGTLKDVTMEIACYSFDQFTNIRRFFSVPCTSIFIQFGYFVNIQDMGAILPPLFCGYGQLTKNDSRAQQSYINSGQYYKNMDNRKIVNADGIIAIVYGFDVIQQDNNVFKLRINMMCKGNSEILNYIKPDLKLAFDFLPTSPSKKQGSVKGKQNSTVSEKKLVENNLTNYIRALSQKKMHGQHSIVLNSDGQRYVTFDWINYVIVHLLRRTTINAFVDKDGSRIPVTDIYNPLYYFDIQKDFDADFYSNTLDVAIIPRGNKIGYPFVYGSESSVEDNIKAKIDDLVQLYSDAFTFIQGEIKNSSVTNKTIIDECINNGKEEIKSYYIDKYMQENSGFKKGKNPSFGYLGHVYFRLQTILQLLKNQQKLTLDSFVTSLADMLTSATNTGLKCSTTFNHRTEIFRISQHSLEFATATDIYYVPNFGPGSIVKQINYNLKMPDGYKVTIFQAYGANSGIMNDLFKRMFSGGKPQDIYLYKGQSDSTTQPDQQKKVDYNAQLENNQMVTKATFNSANGKLNSAELSKDSVKKAVDLYNQALLMVSKDKIQVEIGHRSVSSIYSIQVQITLDFIANVDWGEVFKLQYNPLGWQTKFYVADIQHKIQQGNAETVIKGVMFG